MLKKSSIITLILFLFIQASAQVSLKGELASNAEEKEVYLYQYIGMQAYPFDTIPVKKGKFSKEYPKNFRKGLYLLGVGSFREEIILAEDLVEIAIPSPMTEMPWRDASLANNDYYKIRQENRSYDASLQSLDSIFRTFQYLSQVDPNEYNRRVNILRSSLDSINIHFDNFYGELSRSAKSDYGKTIADFMAITPSTTRENYFKQAQLKNELLASGDFILRKMNYYFMRYGRLDQSNIALECQTLLGYASERNLNRELIFEGLINNALAVSEAQARALQIQHKAEFTENTEVAKRIKNLVPPPAPEIGGPAPEIEAIDKNGNLFKLSDLKGKVVLIDFWASWCGPCRMESPNVVANYNAYKDKGFTVVSVSADKNKEAWLKAIVHDQYTWDNHILSAENNYQAQKDFQVKGYPTMFLIDTDGTIISFGNTLRGQGLTQTLAAVFAKK